MTNRSLFTKLLHGVLLLAVAHQLILVGLVEPPKVGSAGNAFFAWHRSVGLATLGIVTAFWLWTFARRSGTALGVLFPWLSAGRRRALWHDMRAHLNALRRFRVIHADESPLASATHGLGLLVVSAMAGTGAVMALAEVPGGLVLQVHKLLANLTWAYVITHAGIALLHQMQGHGVLQRMFWLRVPARRAQRP